jgi:hypothetical protein
VLEPIGAKSGHGSPTAIMIDTPINAKKLCWFSKIPQEHHE